MEWYQYITCFFAGAVLANAMPHFVHGISGEKFPTPFAKPPGKGLSTPLTNTVWALFNIIIGYLLFRVSKVSTDNLMSVVLMFAGIASMSIMLSLHFPAKDKE